MSFQIKKGRSVSNIRVSPKLHYLAKPVNGSMSSFHFSKKKSVKKISAREKIQKTLRSFPSL